MNKINNFTQMKVILQRVKRYVDTKTAAASGGPSVLSGSAKPSSSQGSNGDIYIKKK